MVFVADALIEASASKGSATVDKPSATTFPRKAISSSSIGVNVILVGGPPPVPFKLLLIFAAFDLISDLQSCQDFIHLSPLLVAPFGRLFNSSPRFSINLALTFAPSGPRFEILPLAKFSCSFMKPSITSLYCRCNLSLKYCDIFEIFTEHHDLSLLETSTSELPAVGDGEVGLSASSLHTTELSESAGESLVSIESSLSEPALKRMKYEHHGVSLPETVTSEFPAEGDGEVPCLSASSSLLVTEPGQTAGEGLASVESPVPESSLKRMKYRDSLKAFLDVHRVLGNSQTRSLRLERKRSTNTSNLPTFSVKAKRGILQQVNVKRQSQLTPRCKVFYKKVTEWSKANANMQRKINSFQERLRNAETALNSPLISYLPKYQVRTQTQAPKSRRFSLEEKIISLSLLKAGGRGYRLLSKVFCLPSRRTLSNLANRLRFKAGLNEHLFDSLKETTNKMKDEREKYCCIMFDEMSISSNLSYHPKDDIIMGLEDFGYKKKPFIADHVNVFMLKGVFKQWKQPLLYTFSSGPIKSTDLKQLIKSVVDRCQSINLRIVASICDQGANNRKTIKDLLKETTEECLRRGEENRNNSSFILNGQDIIPLYDVPHLFKGLRNNLLTKHLHFKLNGQKKVAKWEHIIQFYLLDKTESIRLCPKLTDRHVFASKINKMKVSSCTQVFSHNVGALMLRISKWAVNDRLGLDESAGDTAELILFLDQLFDSINANTKNAPLSKPLKGGVMLDTPHEQFWHEALQIISSMKFYCLKKKRMFQLHH
ncbi:hypothetical protein NQ315_008733 [Exocentrus adspersus]|uniref:Transposable element P transposase n=1 Tax=Exocentrus adspersus TaxID=1586481 RepID=A0AAV8VGM4_9CUCU|nr:hypothetical protein NQ315_008733 [Exocentrus adspersus]